MKAFKTPLHYTLFLTSIGFIALTASNALAQTSAQDQAEGEGIFSYIFSFRAVTVALVLMLAAQIVYRHRRRNSHKLEIVHDHLPANPVRKKRFDRAEMSSLLKASASGTSNPVLLSQPAYPTAAGNFKQSSVTPLESDSVPDAPREIFDEPANTPLIAGDPATAASQSQPDMESEADNMQLTATE